MNVNYEKNIKNYRIAGIQVLFVINLTLKISSSNTWNNRYRTLQNPAFAVVIVKFKSHKQKCFASIIHIFYLSKMKSKIKDEVTILKKERLTFTYAIFVEIVYMLKIVKMLSMISFFYLKKCVI